MSSNLRIPLYIALALLLTLSTLASFAYQQSNVYQYDYMVVESSLHSVKITYTPPKPSIREVNGGYQLLVDGCTSSTWNGFLIPSTSVAVLLPPHYDSVAFEVVSIDHYSLGNLYKIACLTISNDDHVMELGSPTLMPLNHVIVDRVMQMRVYKILKITFLPVVYNFSSKNAFALRSITFRISFNGASARAFPSHLYSKTFEKIVKDVIVNKDMISAYSFTDIKTCQTTVKYVIITSSSLASEAQRLKNHKENAKGLTAEVFTVESIYATYPGDDEPEKIRNFLKDCYTNLGTEWVLIAGDINVVPIRYVHSEVQSNTYDIPTDYYYADLTGDWDSDGDGTYGEPEDNVDWAAEVFVGRLPASSTTELHRLIDKIIMYETSSPSGDWMHRMLFAHAILNYENENGNTMGKTDAAVTAEYIRTNYLPASYTYTRLYEKDGIDPSTYPCEYPLNFLNVQNRLAQGYAWVDFNGHGNEVGIYRKIWTSDDGNGYPEDSKNELSSEAFVSKSTSISNTHTLSLIYASACTSCKIDFTTDSLGEWFVKHPNGGAIGYIGATRVSYYRVAWSTLGDGYNQDLECLFWRKVLGRPIYERHPGKCLYESKLDYALAHDTSGSTDASAAHRHDLFVYILVGDPEATLGYDDDVTPPSFSNPGSDTNFYDNRSDPYKLWITVTDDKSGIYNVSFRYKFETSGWSSWYSFTENISNTYYYHIPRSVWKFHVGESIYWQVQAFDNDNDYGDADRAGSTSPVYGAEGVKDDDESPPMLVDSDHSGDMYDSSHQGYMLSVTVEDPSGISEVLFSYRFGSGSWSSWQPASENVSNTYYYYIPFSEWCNHIGERIYWRVKVWDNDTDRPNDRSFIVYENLMAGMLLDDDTDSPVIIEILVFDENNDSIIDSLEKIMIRVKVTDVSGISEVKLVYDWDGELTTDCHYAAFHHVTGDIYATDSIGPFPALSKLVFKVIAYDNDTDRPNDRSMAESSITMKDIWIGCLAIILDADHEPVPNANVSLTEAGTVLYTSTSNATGVARIASPTGGTFTILVYYMGICVAESNLNLPSLTVVEVYTRIYDWTIQLLDGEGNPAANLTVVVGWSHGTVLLSTSTDEFGRVRLENLPATEYMVKVYWRTMKIHDETYTLSMDEQLTEISCPIHKVSVKVTDFLGRGIYNATVKVKFSNGTLLQVSWTSTHGTVDLGLLPEGEYIIEVEYGKFKDSKEITIDTAKVIEFKLPQILYIKLFGISIQLSLVDVIIIAIILVALIIVAVLASRRHSQE